MSQENLERQRETEKQTNIGMRSWHKPLLPFLSLCFYMFYQPSQYPAFILKHLYISFLVSFSLSNCFLLFSFSPLCFFLSFCSFFFILSLSLSLFPVFPLSFSPLLSPSPLLIYFPFFLYSPRPLLSLCLSSLHVPLFFHFMSLSFFTSCLLSFFEP